MTELQKERAKRYIFLHERAAHWNLWFEGIQLLLFVGFFLLYAIYSTHGFWAGLWDAMKQM